MFGLRYAKATPSTYLIQYRNGQLVREGTVPAVDGSPVAVRADSICVHGDSPGAVAMARAVRERLQDAGVAIRPFCAALA